MNGFNLSSISDLYVGSAQASALYKGSSMIWSAVHDYSKDYFTIESLANNNTIKIKDNDGTYPRTVSVSTDGTNWTSVTSQNANSGTVMATLQQGDKLYIKGNNSNYAVSMGQGTRITSTGNWNVYGNIMSLIYGDNFQNQTTLTDTYCFTLFFSDAFVVDASNLVLPATTLTNYCYYYMFNWCKRLISAPQNLPATTLKQSCYQYMFRNCNNMTSVPTLSVMNLAQDCCRQMFVDCTSLTTVPTNMLPATTLYKNCYVQMFQRCSSLIKAPDLPAATLTDSCYYQMFYGCTKLNNIKCLATDVSASSSISNWLNGVAASGTFYKASSMSSWPSGASGIPSGWTVVNI